MGSDRENFGSRRREVLPDEVKEVRIFHVDFAGAQATVGIIVCIVFRKISLVSRQCESSLYRVGN